MLAHDLSMIFDTLDFETLEIEEQAPAKEKPEVAHPKPPRSTPMTESVSLIPSIASMTSALSQRRSKQQIEHEQAEQAEHYQRCLSRLGQQIRQAREARSLSLSELYSKTFVPIHQLQALEAGQGLYLPEDIYLRGFIKRIAPVLGLDSAYLLDSLPTPDPVKAILPSWYHPEERSRVDMSKLALQPVHLYIGYAALIAGGMAWVSHQTAPTAPEEIDFNSSSLHRSNQSQSETVQKLNTATQVAPPERF